MVPYRVIRRIGDVEHVFVVVADSQHFAKQKLAESQGWTTFSPEEHPWHPRFGGWSVTRITEFDDPIKLYSFNLKTGDMG